MTKENNGWINIKERLPKKGQKVIIYINDKDMDTYLCIHVAYYVEEDDESYFETADDSYSEMLVSHWRPLPEPPK